MYNKKNPKKIITCSKCGHSWEDWNNPVPTVDALIEVYEKNIFKGVVLIERLNYPFGWAIPGGFMEYGEKAETTCIREAKEETGLEVEIKYLLGFYTDPKRDPRSHTVTAVYVCRSGDDIPIAGDDAKTARIFSLKEIPNNLVFDHNLVIEDYKRRKYNE